MKKGPFVLATVVDTDAMTGAGHIWHFVVCNN